MVKKSVLASYLFWVFLGWVGGHRFYLRKPGTAVLMIVLLVMSTILGLIPFFALLIWWIIDAFLIPGIVRRHNKEVPKWRQDLPVPPRNVGKDH